MEDLTRMREALDNQNFGQPALMQLQQRTWLMHWSLHVFWNHENGRNALIDLFMQPAYISSLQVRGAGRGARARLPACLPPVGTPQRPCAQPGWQAAERAPVRSSESASTGPMPRCCTTPPAGRQAPQPSSHCRPLTPPPPRARRSTRSTCCATSRPRWW